MGDEIALLRATVLKLRAERRLMHEMLTEVGIREDVLADGVRTCLIGRLGVALDRLPRQTGCPATADGNPMCGATCPGCRREEPRCA